MELKGKEQRWRAVVIASDLDQAVDLTLSELGRRAIDANVESASSLLDGSRLDIPVALLPLFNRLCRALRSPLVEASVGWHSAVQRLQREYGGEESTAIELVAATAVHAVMEAIEEGELPVTSDMPPFSTPAGVICLEAHPARQQ
ncbi:MAG: hypothetical protein LC721_03490 [Actinobacteria bacterium]|nr:hypothetical protein [Actinomycetota bacterium]